MDASEVTRYVALREELRKAKGGQAAKPKFHSQPFFGVKDRKNVGAEHRANRTAYRKPTKGRSRPKKTKPTRPQWATEKQNRWENQ
jgi:hypothetical protein